MFSIKTALLMLTFVVVAAAYGCSPGTNDHAAEQRITAASVVPVAEMSSADQSFAVVELFTSEGCSSCPPADKLLSEIVTEARAAGQHIYPLAFHVDYWNRLGWSDPFSDAAYSQRQQSYGEALSLRSIYTPQMIVNGTSEFVGSERTEAQRSIADALKQKARCEVTLHVRQQAEQSRLTVEYEVSAAPNGSVLNIAVVERGLSTQVPRGENAGRTLEHDNVVRAFTVVKLDAGSRGETTLDLPGTLKAANASVIAYVQQLPTMAILGASQSELP